MEQDPLDSSDWEFGPGPANPFAQAGKASIEAIIENATRDRFTSKQASKQLKYVKGSRKTQYLNNLWYGRFQAFRQHTLKLNVNDTPTGEHVERFMTSIVALVKPTTHEVPSYSWAKGAVVHLIGSLIFHHSAFTLSRHETERIATNIDDLWQQGRLTKEPTLEKSWVGAFLVRRLVMSLLHQSLSNGTISWDGVLAKMMAIVVVTALAARAGDVTPHRLDEQELPFLCYRDVTIKLVGGKEMENLQASFLIRGEKGHKTDPAKNRTVHCHSLISSSDNALCPIKLVLIMALRLGNVRERSIDDLLQQTRSRRDKTIAWIDGKRPVFCALNASGAGLNRDKPAGSHQLTQIMAEVGLIAGILAPLTGHSLRYGAARDTAHLTKKIHGVATHAVAATLGHSNRAHARGVTAKYVGSTSDDMWTKRLEADFQDPFGLEVTDTTPPLTLKRKAKPSEISAGCLAEGLDPLDQNARRRVAKKRKKDAVNVWMQTELDRVDAPPDCSEKDEIPSRKVPNRIGDAPVASPLDTPKPHSDISAGYMKRTLPAMDEAAPSGDAWEDDFPIDPQLLAQGEELGHVLASSEDMIVTDDMERAAFDQMENPAPVDNKITVTPVEFVRYFSKINITTNQNLVGGTGTVADRKISIIPYQGGSRDEPSGFPISCPNAIFGCSYRSSARNAIATHEVTCKITSVEAGRIAFERSKTQKAHQCDREGCSKSYDALHRLNQHVKNAHNWEPRACTERGCNSTVIFQTQYRLNRHMRVHTKFKATKCTFPRCTTNILFAHPTEYRRHLTRVHKVVGAAVNAYRQPRDRPYTAQKCPVLNCKSNTIFKSKKAMTKHLKDIHDFDKDERDAYFEE